MIPSSTPLPAELLALVGTGSDGAVHRARQHGLDREVALKLPVAGAEPGDLRREALAAAAVEHPGAVVVHGVGAGWLMSQLVEGGTLADRLAEHPGPLSGERLGPVVEALAAVADTLATAHALGVVHGEVLAEHILLGRYGEVVLVDWGRALRLGHGPAGLPEAATADPGRIAPAARAPELLAGDRAAVGVATDVWQLGRVLAAAIRLEEGRDPGPGRPPALVALAESALGPVPGRPAAAALAAGLRAWIQGSAGSALALALRGDAERIAAAVPAESAAAVAAWQRVEHLARSARLHDPGLAVDDLLAAARRGRLRLALAAGDLAHARTAARALGPDLDPDDGAALAVLTATTARREAWRRLAIRAATAGGVAALLVLLAWPLLRWQESAARESARRAEAVRLAAAARAEPDPGRGLETALVAAGLDPAGPGAAVAARLAASAAVLAVDAGRAGAAAEAFALASRFALADRDPALAARLGAGPDTAGSVAWAAAAATRAAQRTAAERAAAVAGWLDGDPDLDEAALAAAAARWGAWDPLDGADADRLRGWWRRALAGGTAQGRLACRVAAAAFRRGVRIYPAADLLPVIARPDLRTAAAEAVALAGDDGLYEPVFTALAADQSWSDRSPVLAGWMRRLEAPVMAAARAATTADAALRRRIEKTLWRHRALQVQSDHRDLSVLLATDPDEAEELSAFNALSLASFHNDWPTALTAAERLIAVRPERESYWADAVQAANRIGDSAGAWARAHAALARFPDPGARLLVQAAAAARDAGASASAAPLIQAARAAMAASAISDTRTLETFRGLIAGLPGGADEAVAVARAHRANRPDDGWKTVDLAEALIEAERYDEAVAIADEGLARWPDFHFIHANRALALARLGRMDEALAAAERAVSIYPRNPGILRYQSQVLDLAGRREHALSRLLMGLALHNRWPVQDEVLTLARRIGPRADGDAFTAARAVLADPGTYGGLPRMFAGLQAVRIACERDQAWAALPVIDAMAAIAERPAAATAALAVLAVGIPAWQEPGAAPVADLDVAWTLVQDAGAILAATRAVTATAAARIAARCAAALRLAGDNAFVAGRARAYQAVVGGDATAALAALLTVGEGVEAEIAQIRRHLLDPAQPLLPLDYDRWDGWTVRRPIPDLGFDAAGIDALGALLVRRGATAAPPAPDPRWRRVPDKQLTRHLGGVDRGWDFPPASYKARQAALAAAKADAARSASAAASATAAAGR